MFAALAPSCLRPVAAKPALRMLSRRAFASAPPPSGSGETQRKGQSNWPLWVSLAGLGGLGYWVYLQRTGKLVNDPTRPFKDAYAGRPPSNSDEARNQREAEAGNKPTVSALNKDEFRPFELAKKEDYNYNTAKYTFKLPEGTATLLPVASCVLIKAADDEKGPKDDKGKPVVRPYTPISEPERVGEVDFLIKKYDNGKFTPWLASLKPGDKVAIKGPLSKFPYKPNQFEQCGMIAGGSGITPMYQLVTHSLSIPEDKTKWTLIFANISSKDILLRSEFDELQKKHPDRFQVVYVIDKPEKSFDGPTRYVTKELIKQHIAGPDKGEKVKVFVCGPPGQVEAVAGKKDGMKQGALGGALKKLGYKEDQVFKF